MSHLYPSRNAYRRSRYNGHTNPFAFFPMFGMGNTLIVWRKGTWTHGKMWCRRTMRSGNRFGLPRIRR